MTEALPALARTEARSAAVARRDPDTPSAYAISAARSRRDVTRSSIAPDVALSTSVVIQTRSTLAADPALSTVT